MSMSNAAELDWLKFLLNNTTWAGVGDTTGLVGSGTAGSLFLGFHTADPGEGGDQTTSEATYGGYSRTAMARSSSAFTCTANPAVNAAQVNLPSWTSGSTNTLTFFGLGKASSGTGELLLSGPLTNSVVLSAGNPTASIAAGALTITAD